MKTLFTQRMRSACTETWMVSFFAWVCLFPLGIRTPAQAAEEGELALASSSTSAVQLQVGRTTARHEALFNLRAAATRSELKEGVLRLEQLSVAVFGVDQESLLKNPSRSPRKGVLSLTAQTGRVQRLRYSRDSLVLQASIPMVGHFPRLTHTAPLRFNEKDDDVEVRQQAAVVSIRLTLKEPLKWAESDGPQKAEGVLSLDIRAEADERIALSAYRLQLREPNYVFEYGFLQRFEVVKELCVQPVRIRSSAADLNITGAGLSFGLPGARTQWRKGDVLFQVRPWITVTEPNLKTLGAAEAVTLLATVQVDDCVEIFFAEVFSPEAMWGGGATFAGGQATTQIITSDAQVPFGIDLTHLAHELGHAMTLKHPGQATATRPAGSTGTLMCPSGYLNDNPDVNSSENRSNIANPLFRVRFARRGPLPDCANSADCGPC